MSSTESITICPSTDDMAKRSRSPLPIAQEVPGALTLDPLNTLP